MTSSVLRQLQRVAVDIGISLVLMGLFFRAGTYEGFTPPQQLVALKMLLVSIGFLHAHIVGKLAFPKVSWTGDFTGGHLVRVILYAVFVYAYAQGG